MILIDMNTLFREDWVVVVGNHSVVITSRAILFTDWPMPRKVTQVNVLPQQLCMCL